MHVAVACGCIPANASLELVCGYMRARGHRACVYLYNGVLRVTLGAGHPGSISLVWFCAFHEEWLMLHERMLLIQTR